MNSSSSFCDIDSLNLVATSLAFTSCARRRVQATVVFFLFLYPWLGGDVAFSNSEEFAPHPKIAAGLWEYQPEGSPIPKTEGYLQCFDESKTPWSVSVDAACQGFAQESWQRTGRQVGKKTSFRWEGEEFVAETICTGESSTDVHVLQVSGGWSGDFRRRLLLTGGGGAGFGDRKTALSEADAMAQRRILVGRLLRVSDCPKGMAPGDYCGSPEGGRERRDRSCPEGVRTAPMRR